MNGMPRFGFDCKRFAFLKAIPLGLIVLLCALVLSWSGHLMAQTIDSLLDFSLVMPPQGEKIKLVQPEVSWLVRADASQYC